ncbi:protein translocase subunit SecD [Clostridium sp. DL1XJH146]
MKSSKKGNVKIKSTSIFIALVLFIGLFAYTSAFGFSNIFGYKINPISATIKKGLDLQGGISVLEEIKGEDVDDDTVARTIELLNMRINPEGVKEVSILREGENRIRIEIPGEFDSGKVLNSIGRTGKLEFRDPDGNVLLEGTDIEDASARLDEFNQPLIILDFNDEGAVKFAEATEEFVGQTISIYMDDEELTSPTVKEAIRSGSAQIDGSVSLEEAQSKANIIKSGALPVTLEVAEYKTVGATLGQSALPLSVKAGLIGIALVFLFMFIIYRLPGIMASIALVLYIVLVLGTFNVIEATLTLSGIAGFLLTVGMAVDANVLIFERIKEELKIGKTIGAAIDSGFSRALSSILDSNITTFIAGIVLYSMGSGSVKGFALTLMIGIVWSIFTALTITRTLLNLGVKMGIISSKSHFGINEKKNSKPLKIIEKTKVWLTISIIIIAIGIMFTFTKGYNLGIDFMGGTLATIEMGEEVTTQDKEIIDGIIMEFDENATSNMANDTQIEIRSNSISEEDVSEILQSMKEEFGLDDDALLSESKVGPSVGSELKQKAIKALAVATILMLIYIAIRFELTFGLAAIIALLHDVLITLSVFVIFDIPINTPFIAAMLTIVGYSINDTIVVFDRIRENSKKMKGEEIKKVTNISISQTITRSIYTSLTTLFTIVAVYILVPAVRDFSFPLIIGIISGAYSSIFIASPVWVMLKSRKNKNLE